MKLVTFQSYDALKSLICNGYLECDSKYIDLKKVGPTYQWVKEKMSHMENKTHATYPLWAWVKCYNGICPPKRKGKKIEGFDVKITFHKEEKDVFITDFIRYSFLLNNMYIPTSMKDKNEFDRFLQDANITKEELKAYVRKDKYESCRNDKKFMEACGKIKDSFDRCITKDSSILQGCVYRIDLSEVEKIEIVDDNYIEGSVNYVRANGKRKDWKEEFYKSLK